MKTKSVRWIWFSRSLLDLFFLYVYRYMNGNKQAEEGLWQSHKAWLWWFFFLPMLLSDAKRDVLCFATGTFACTAGGQSLRNQIEKICFLHFSITSYLTQEPISCTMCQSGDGEERSSRGDGNKDAPCWHKMKRRHASLCHLHGIPERFAVNAKVFDLKRGSDVCSNVQNT